MNTPVKIRNVLISVSYKANIEPVISKLAQLGVTVYATSGTEQFLRNFPVATYSVEDLTSYASILGGRVKTLHPKIFGGILSRRTHPEDRAQLQQYAIPEIDLVIVDLYPFEQTLYSGASEDVLVEQIDIGGIALIRAAAKNFQHVLVVSSKEDYQVLENILSNQNGVSSLEQRKKFACKAFHLSSLYDTLIFQYLNQGEDQNENKHQAKQLPVLKQHTQTHRELRYGENPHQKGVFYGDLDALFTQLNGKPLSYNNLVDTDAALALISEFDTPTIAILKHTNACGMASRTSIRQAWVDALACDPISSFGGVIVANRTIDETTAKAINRLFFEVLIAPSYTKSAIKILSEKKNRIILAQKIGVKLPSRLFKTLLNGIIEQDRDNTIEGPTSMKIVTKKQASTQEIEDLFFANKVVKHSKSNAIVLAKNRQLIGSGIGQTSRIDALKQAIAKAKSLGWDLCGAVMASDAFFPFPDCVEIAAEAGITAIVQPGGSLKDQDSINMANQKGVAMFITGVRHFKH